MRAAAIFCSLLVLFMRTGAQDAAPMNSFDDLTQAIDAIRAADIAERQVMVDALWEQLSEAGRIPFIDGENVVFLYRGEARSVDWVGDWTWFERTPGGRGQRIEGTDLWVAVMSFPLNARLEYGIRLGGSPTVLADPENPHQVPGLFGGFFSELAMPDYVRPAATIRDDSVPQGALTVNIIIEGSQLGYSIAYRVYTPAGYESLKDLKSIYVLDGEMFLQDDFGAMVIVLDNLIAQGVIEPAIAVFIDARHPERPELNRRMLQFIENAPYADFIADELVPAVDSAYKTARDAGSRLAVGASSGGIGVLYLGIHRPDTFAHIAAFSPWLPEARRLFSLYEAADGLTLDFFVVSGLPEWDAGDLTRLLDTLDAESYPYRYLEDSQAHNLKLWRDALDDALLYFFPAVASTD